MSQEAVVWFSYQVVAQCHLAMFSFSFQALMLREGVPPSCVFQRKDLSQAAYADPLVEMLPSSQ